MLELHPFTQERLNDLEIDFRRHEADFGEAAHAKILARLDKLEDKPAVSLEGLDTRVTSLKKELGDFADGAITLKKVRVIVEDAIDAQHETIKRMRNKLNECDERCDRAASWRSDVEQQILELTESIDERVSKINHQVQEQIRTQIEVQTNTTGDKLQSQF